MSIRTLIKPNRLKLNSETFKYANESNQLSFQANHTGPIKSLNVNPSFNQVCSLSNYNNAAVVIPTMKGTLESTTMPIIDSDRVDNPVINFLDGTTATISTAYYNFMKIGKILRLDARIELAACSTSGGLLSINLLTLPYGLQTLTGRVLPGNINYYITGSNKQAPLSINLGTLNNGLFATVVLTANITAETVTLFVSWCFDI